LTTESTQEAEPTKAGVAFYSVSEERYFLGAVALINSLRLIGHSEPVFLLDCGLTDEQRKVLVPHVTLVPGPSDAAPHLLKTIAPMKHPEEVMVLIDADIIVTRPLTPLIEAAVGGRVVAFKNHRDRFVPEWGELLELGQIRRQPYLCSGLVAMSQTPGRGILSAMQERSSRVDLDRTFFAKHDWEYPLLYADQDILNAILASRVERDRVVSLDHRLAPMPPFEGLRVVDKDSLRCSYGDGTEPYILHHSLSPKPWQEPAYDGVYTRLLRRLLRGPDVPVRVPGRETPLGLRTGLAAYLERQRVKLQQQLRWRLDGIARAIS
jgi:hypothetical protein